MNNLAYNLYQINSEKSGVSRLTLTDFRNYQFLRINVESDIVIIHGENGTGKTNILEAISFLSPGKGLRGAKLADIKRIVVPENDEYKPELISPFNWAISAETFLGNDTYSIGTAVENSTRESDTEEDEYKSYERRIVKINEYAEFTPKNVQTREERTRLVYGIKVQFENPELILKSGMTIESTLMPNEKY